MITLLFMSIMKTAEAPAISEEGRLQRWRPENRRISFKIFKILSKFGHIFQRDRFSSVKLWPDHLPHGLEIQTSELKS